MTVDCSFADTQTCTGSLNVWLLWVVLVPLVWSNTFAAHKLLIDDTAVADRRPSWMHLGNCG